MSDDWRSYGDVPLKVYESEFARLDSPMLPDALSVWAAAVGYSALALAMMFHEQKYATQTSIPLDYHNCLSLTKPGTTPRDGVNRWMRFDSWAAGVKAWKDRITSPVYKLGAYALTETLEDLISVYAPSTDGNDEARYVAVVEERIAAYKEQSMADLNMTKGLIPLDFIENDIISWSELAERDQSISCRGYDDLGNRPDPPRFLVIHRAQDDPQTTLGHPDGWFTQPGCVPALTDLEVNAVTGRMRRFVGRGHAPSGWANGVVSAPYGDALAWLNQVGWDLDSVNRDGEACEIHGWFAQPGQTTTESPWSQQAKTNLATWIASRAHDYGIAWHDFPLVAREGNRSYVTWHQEWTIGTKKVCPGRTIVDDTPAIIELARAKMKAAQTGAEHPPVVTIPAYAAPDIPPFMLEDAKAGGPRDHVYNNTQIYACRRMYTAKKDTRRLRVADTSRGAAVIGPKIRKGETFEGWYFFRSGGQTFVLTPFYSRVQTSGITPTIRIA